MKLKRQYSKREIDSILKNNGWTYHRQRGSHKIYKKDERHISIGTCKYNAMIFQRLIKENNLIVL